MGRRGRETQEQRDRENSLARIRYKNGYSEFHHEYYATNADKYREHYLTKVKPNLEKPEVKEHRNKLQQARRAKAKAEREALRKSMPFAAYKELLAKKKKEKLKKKERIQLIKKDRQQAGRRLVKDCKKQIKRVIQKIKLQRWLKKQRLKRQTLSDLIFVINRKQIYRKVIQRIRIKKLSEDLKERSNGETNGICRPIISLVTYTFGNRTLEEMDESKRKCS